MSDRRRAGGKLQEMAKYNAHVEQTILEYRMPDDRRRDGYREDRHRIDIDVEDRGKAGLVTAWRHVKT